MYRALTRLRTLSPYYQLTNQNNIFCGHIQIYRGMVATIPRSVILWACMTHAAIKPICGLSSLEAPAWIFTAKAATALWADIFYTGCIRLQWRNSPLPQFQTGRSGCPLSCPMINGSGVVFALGSRSLLSGGKTNFITAGNVPGCPRYFVKICAILPGSRKSGWWKCRPNL